MRVVLDPNVIISALLSPSNAPAHVLLAWQAGAFELLVSRLLLAELERALGYEKLRKLISHEEVGEVLQWLRRSATPVSDPDEAPRMRSPDPGDDYLLALASAERAALVSGDKHLLELAADLPVFTPARFLALLDERIDALRPRKRSGASGGGAPKAGSIHATRSGGDRSSRERD